MFHILYGTKAVHDSGLVHRDMKSENVRTKNSSFFLITADKIEKKIFISDGVCKIGDFGLAGKFSKQSNLKSKDLLGTYAYCSPQIITREQYNHKTDLFSLGCIFYELITGKILCELQVSFGELASKDQLDYKKIEQEMLESCKSEVLRVSDFLFKVKY